MTIKEMTEKIREVGVNNTRITPINGKYKLEINTKSGWVTLINNITQRMAEDIIKQSSSRVIID